jgi:Fe-Mn family superoxide dismutase
MRFVTSTIILSSKSNSNKNTIDLEFKDLPYEYNALEPVIDSETMKIHHSKHQKKYYDNMMEILDKNPELKKKKIVDLLENLNLIPKADREKFKNNAGGHFNHSFFWNVMSPKKIKYSGEIKKLIDDEFGSLESFKEEFVKTGLDQFGSGWIWLCIRNNQIKLSSMDYQNNPHIENCGLPLIGCDVWEHAYYLKYKNDRESYLNAWFDVVNWAFPEKILGEL